MQQSQEQQGVVTMNDEQGKRARAKMRELVMHDLARRGLGDDDLEGLERDAQIVSGQVRSWRLIVKLTEARAPLVYEMEAREGATLQCNGAPLAPVQRGS